MLIGSVELTVCASLSATIDTGSHARGSHNVPEFHMAMSHICVPFIPVFFALCVCGLWSGGPQQNKACSIGAVLLRIPKARRY